jgi:hypothetical protein
MHGLPVRRNGLLVPGLPAHEKLGHALQDTPTPIAITGALCRHMSSRLGHALVQTVGNEGI